MIEITIRLKGPAQARRLATVLRTLADTDEDRGQAKTYRGAARRLEHLARPFRSTTTRPPRPAHTELDEEAVQRAVQGLRPLPMLSRAEARIACWRLTARRCSAREIAERIGVTPRTVNRWRAEDQAVTR
jgi:DNA-binding CsgD family transcriptional regulator